MSDPVTNADIEDVLSSIRRLVSESAEPQTASARPDASGDARPDAGGPDAVTDVQGAEAPKAEKLVLTPAFRVHDTSEQDTSAQDTAAPSQTIEDAALADEVMFLHRPIRPGQQDTPGPSRMQDGASAEDERAGDHQRGEGAQDVTPAPAAAPEKLDENGGAQEGAAEASSRDLADTDTRDVTEKHEEQEEQEERKGDTLINWPPAVDLADTDGVEEDMPLDHRVAELEAAVTNSAVEFEPDLGDAVEDIGPGIFLRKRAGLDDASQQVPTGQAPADTDENAGCDAAPEEVASKEVAPERAAELRSDAPHSAPDGAQSWEAFDAEIAAFIDDDKEIEGTASPLSSAPQGEDPILDAADDTDVLDEDMLRDLVARLVREELQGEVGEKITRNVRRLVRREVERALTLKSLD